MAAFKPGIFFFSGIEHSIDFMCCDCEPLPLTLARAELWPATPSHPRLAFTFSLLDWAEALLLESQVALKDFCSSLYLRCPVKVFEVLPVVQKSSLSKLLFCHAEEGHV